MSRDPRKFRLPSCHSFTVQDMTVCAGPRTRCTTAHSPQPQSLWAPGRVSNAMCGPALISTFGKGDTRSQVVFRVFISRYRELTESWSHILMASRMDTVLARGSFKPLGESLSGRIPWECFGNSSGDANVPLRFRSTSLQDTLAASLHPRIQGVRLRHRCSSLTLG